MKFHHQLMAVAITAAFSGSALAAVSAEEAKQLGTTLTPWGAEKAGNKEGTIPAYTGTDRPKPPASYNPKERGNMPDPYPNEKPLFVITAQNYKQYGDKVTDGQQAMFQKYPNYRIDVYPTHRPAVHEQTLLDMTIKNATACKAVSNGLRLEGCYGGFPFPIPKTGNEAMWSHIMSHPAYDWDGHIHVNVVDTLGRVQLQAQYHTVQTAVYRDPKRYNTVFASNEPYWQLRFDAEGPARRIGEKTIIVDGLDPLDPGRRAWTYIPGQRRVKLAPDLAYDTPSPASGGSSTMDENRIFLGAQDRYNMKLIGKKEVFMPYSVYKMTDYKVCPTAVSHTKNYINPDCLRWELHRAWVVEATIKPGFRHVLPHRIMYFDEDTWGGGMGDSWDAAGKLYRVDLNPIYPWYYLPVGQNAGDYTITYDLQTGIYGSTAGTGWQGPAGESVGYTPSPKHWDNTFYSPEALAGEGIR
jgi:Protein of unknown function (DUF1329)